MTEVVILGGGFSGVSCALRLFKLIQNDDIKITVIDKNSYHLFTPSLYEVATSEEPKKNIAVPYSEIFKEKIKFIQGSISNIDVENHLVHLSDGVNYSFDYLVIALGSEPAYFDIEGLKKYSIPLKSLDNAVEIRKKIESVYHQKALSGKQIKVVVGGGGFSGTELTAELIRYKEHLSKHHKLSNDLIKITVIQGSQSLLKELDKKDSDLAFKRLQSGGVEILLGSHIKRVDEKIIETDDGKKHSYDILIWTGGIKAVSVLENSNLKTNGRGQVPVSGNMLVTNYNNIFAIGDVAEYANPFDNKPSPQVAEVAEDEGRIAAENVYKLIKGKSLIDYHYLHVGYVVPLKGKFAVADFNRFRIIGFLGWVLQQAVFLYYLLKILPFTKAFKKWNKFEMYLMRS